MHTFIYNILCRANQRSKRQCGGSKLFEIGNIRIYSHFFLSFSQYFHSTFLLLLAFFFFVALTAVRLLIYTRTTTTTTSTKKNQPTCIEFGKGVNIYCNGIGFYNKLICAKLFFFYSRLTLDLVEEIIKKKFESRENKNKPTKNWTKKIPAYIPWHTVQCTHSLTHPPFICTEKFRKENKCRVNNAGLYRAVFFLYFFCRSSHQQTKKKILYIQRDEKYNSTERKKNIEMCNKIEAIHIQHRKKCIIYIYIYIFGSNT